MQNLKGDAEEEETFLNNEKPFWSHFAVQLCNAQCACIILLQHLLPKLICRSDWAPKVKSYASLLSFNMHSRWSFWKQAYEIPKERKKPWTLFYQEQSNTALIFVFMLVFCCWHLLNFNALSLPLNFLAISPPTLFANVTDISTHLGLVSFLDDRHNFFTRPPSFVPHHVQLCSIDGSNSCVWKYQVGTMIAS